MQTFPNIQFIITTCSPQILSNVEKEEAFIIKAFKIIGETTHTKGKDSNSILYDILGVDERPKKYKDKFSNFYILMKERKFSGAIMMLDELIKKFGEKDKNIINTNFFLK